MKTQKQFYVYLHLRPTNDGVNSIFYVGKAIKKRSNSVHRKHNQHHTRIVAKYGAENIIIRKLACKSEQHAFDLEIQMIAKLREIGVKLTNATNGGDGTSGWIASKETRKRMSIAVKSRVVSIETRLKMSMSAKNKPPMSEETRAKKREAMKKVAPLSKEARAKISKALTGRKLSDEHKAKISMRSKNISPETRAKISSSSKGRKQSPETIAKREATRIANGKKRPPRTPETLEKMRLAQIGKKRKPHTEETKAKIKAAAAIRKQKKLEQQEQISLCP